MTSSEPAHTGAREDALLAGLYVQLEEDYLPNQRPAYDVEAGLGRFIAWLERPRGVTGSARPFNNPILSWSESSGVRLRPRRARPGTALVLVDRRGALLTEWYHRPSPLRARMTARSAYMVDVAEHWLTFACELPCSDDVRRFQVDVDLTWRVHDPAEVVLRNLNDVAAILRPWVEQRMRLVSRKADSLEPEKVEAEINQRLGVAPHQLDCGIIITTLYAKVTLDAAELVHLRMREEFRRQVALEHERDALDKARYENRMRQVERVAELRDREAVRLREVVHQGLVGVLAEYLAVHPGDQAYVVGVLRKEHRAKVRTTARMVQSMLSTETLEGVDLDRVREHALRTLLEGLEGELGARQERRADMVAEITTESPTVDARDHAPGEEGDNGRA